MRRQRMKRKWIAAAIGAAVLVLGAAVAVATPGSGIVEAPVLARGSFTDDVGIKFTLKGPGGTQILNAKDPSEALVQKIVIGPGGHTGWHSHPGPVVVVVASGELTFYDAEDPTCTGIAYPAGSAFVDPGHGHVHIARNLSTTENLELYATYFEVPPGVAGAQRIDAPDPGTC
jgi:quercetin dioxygenase-like cupin family protein